MTTDIISRIRARQDKQNPKLDLLPRHQPEMLYIGCSDARLDPIDDIGIPKGKALIYRNIGALVRKGAREGFAAASADANAIFSSGEIPESMSMGAALEFFIRHIPAGKGVVKHIVVSGHTHCGGIHACLHETGKHDEYLPNYLSVLADARRKVLAAMPDASTDDKLRALEQESVRLSVANLMSYEVVRQAVAQKTLQVHGWVINTATQRIMEMGPAGQFSPMALDGPPTRVTAATGKRKQK